MTTRIGEYEVTKEVVGKGTFGKVYLALHTTTRAKAALKIIRLTGVAGQTPAAVLQEVQEMNRLQSFAHPNIIRLLDQQKNDKCLCLVLEYCEGGDMQKAILEKGAMPEAVARPLFRGIVEGMCFLNELRVLHRDLKPANIFLTSKDLTRATVRIADLGLAKSYAAGNPSLQQSSRGGGTGSAVAPNCSVPLGVSTVGTPSYMSPERLMNEKYTFQAEVWAAGLILYEMLYGECLFKDARDFADLMERQRQVQRHLVFPASPAVSREAQALILRALQYDPAARPTIQEVRSAPWLSMAAVAATPTTAAGTPAATAAGGPPPSKVSSGTGTDPSAAGPPVAPNQQQPQPQQRTSPLLTAKAASTFSVSPMLVDRQADPVSEFPRAPPSLLEDPQPKAPTAAAAAPGGGHGGGARGASPAVHIDPSAVVVVPSSGSATRRGDALRELPPLAPSAGSAPRGSSIDSVGGWPQQQQQPTASMPSSAHERSLSPPVMLPVVPSSVGSDRGGGFLLSRSPRIGPSPPPEGMAPLGSHLSVSSGGGSNSSFFSSMVLHRVSVMAERTKLVAGLAAEERLMHPGNAIALYCYAAMVAGRSAESECKQLRQQCILQALSVRQGLTAPQLTALSAVMTHGPQSLLFAKACWLAENKACEMLLAERSAAASNHGLHSPSESMEDAPFRVGSFGHPLQAAAVPGCHEAFARVACILEVLADDPDLSDADRMAVEALSAKSHVLLS